jgi:hypothetical protein
VYSRHKEQNHIPTVRDNTIGGKVPKILTNQHDEFVYWSILDDKHDKKE